MTNSGTQENRPQSPPAGYPTENPPPAKTRKKLFHRSKPKGERGFIEGCLFALCCCWLCEECCL